MKQTAICYFSSTGNGFDISNRLSKTVNGDIINILNTDLVHLEKYERIILVSPVYSFGLPIPVKTFIASMKDMPNKTYTLILHYGGFMGNAAYFAQSIFKKYGLSLENIYTMKMPENFTLFATVPQFYMNRQLKKSTKKVAAIGNQINKNKKRIIRKNIFSFCDNIHKRNAAKWPVLAKNFIVDKNCTHCGYCQEICPSKNILVTEDTVLFKNHCVACLGCYHRCPHQAINYGNKTQEKSRYKNPNVDFSKMK